MRMGGEAREREKKVWRIKEQKLENKGIGERKKRWRMGSRTRWRIPPPPPKKKKKRGRGKLLPGFELATFRLRARRSSN